MLIDPSKWLDGSPRFIKVVNYIFAHLYFKKK